MIGCRLTCVVCGYVGMYVRIQMYVCMYICIYVCMYVDKQHPEAEDLRAV